MCSYTKFLKLNYRLTKWFSRKDGGAWTAQCVRGVVSVTMRAALSYVRTVTSPTTYTA